MKHLKNEILSGDTYKMNVSSGVNPFQSDREMERAEIIVTSGTVTYNREPPPPYSVSEGTHQPIIHQTIIVQPPLNDGPMLYNCPRCRDRVLTRVEFVNTKKTHMLAGFICGFTFWCMLCCLAAIPYLIPTFKKAEHYCPHCNVFLGAYSKV